jgi:hypothetical protein
MLVLGVSTKPAVGIRFDDPLLVMEVPLILAAVDEDVPVLGSSLLEVTVEEPVTEEAIEKSGVFEMTFDPLGSECSSGYSTLAIDKTSLELSMRYLNGDASQEFGSFWVVFLYIVSAGLGGSNMCTIFKKRSPFAVPLDREGPLIESAKTFRTYRGHTIVKEHPKHPSGDAALKRQRSSASQRHLCDSSS